MKTASRVGLIVCACLGLAEEVRGASDVTISSAATSGGSFAGSAPLVFTPTAAAANADLTTIQGQLDGGGGATVNTASAAGGNGDLTLSESLTKSAGAGSTLTLNAVRDLVFAA